MRAEGACFVDVYLPSCNHSALFPHSPTLCNLDHVCFPVSSKSRTRKDKLLHNFRELVTISPLYNAGQTEQQAMVQY
jgi:hypothetical protein